jgi:hypothetical protein
LGASAAESGRGSGRIRNRALRGLARCGRRPWFQYQPAGWSNAYRFVALRYEKKKWEPAGEKAEQYQLFDTPEYSYRVFATNMTGGMALLTWFYNQRAGAENLIQEAKNDAGMADHPSARWAMNCIYFQLPMLAYNLNCWLMRFNREEQATVETLGHTTLATARLTQRRTRKRNHF